MYRVLSFIYYKIDLFYLFYRDKSIGEADKFTRNSRDSLCYFRQVRLRAQAGAQKILKNRRDAV